MPGKRGREQPAQCAVCCDAFSAVVRKPVRCPFCEYEACMRCTQRVLLDQDAPACMSCKREWQRPFLDSTFPASFVHDALKRRRERVLLQRELALMPQSQDMVRNYRLAAEAMTRYRRHLAEAAAHHGAAARLLDQVQRARAASYAFAPGEAGGAPAERRAFVRRCGAEGCRGFVSTQWKCGTCGAFTCRHCCEPLPPPPSEHRCDPGARATMEALARDSKPCPSCGEVIHKIDGCDQMWCTACRTPFSWRTLRVITHGRFHNPHMYQYQHQHAQPAVRPRPREDGDLVGCGGLPDAAAYRARVGACPALRPLLMRLSESVRLVHHVQDVQLGALPREFTPALNADLRLSFLLGRIDEHDLQVLLQRRDKRRAKGLEDREVLTTAVATAGDILLREAGGEAGAEEALRELEELQVHATRALEDVAARYKVRPRRVALVVSALRQGERGAGGE